MYICSNKEKLETDWNAENISAYYIGISNLFLEHVFKRKLSGKAKVNRKCMFKHHNQEEKKDLRVKEQGEEKLNYFTERFGM